MELYKTDLCHGHHLQWLSRGGEDTLDNMMLVCPNHHAAIHQCDAPFDFGDMAFIFPTRREPIRIDRHIGKK